VVAPVRNRPEHLRGLLACLPTTIRAIVVDDASDDDSAAVGRALGCAVLSLDQHRGPSGARNAGWRATDAAFVAFIDSDCRPEPGTLERLKAHFADASVGAVAPRIRAVLDSSSGIVQRYEACRSSEDLGPWPALVRPLSKVAYVPAVLLVVRRTALVEIGGFDEEMPLGEDVDLVWRLVEARWAVRYDPDVCAAHDHRRRLATFLLRKLAYGSAAAGLERRHPGWVAPPRLPLIDSVAWLVFVAQPFWGLAALALVAIGYLVQSNNLASAPSPSGVLRRILANGTVLADACVRTWLPASIAASLLVPRLGVLLVVGAIASGVLDWRRCKCRLAPLRFVAIRSLDDAAYSIGVWWGCLRHRSFAPLIPKFVGLRRRAAGAQPDPYGA
jgi:mycofactocin system glycosyltransferase